MTHLGSAFDQMGSEAESNAPLMDVTRESRVVIGFPWRTSNSNVSMKD
jgi:hypothetical protein